MRLHRPDKAEKTKGECNDVGDSPVKFSVLFLDYGEPEPPQPVGKKERGEGYIVPVLPCLPML